MVAFNVNKEGITKASLPQKSGSQLVALWGDFMRYLGFATLIGGIVTAVLDKSFGGFVPLYWFLLAIFFFIIVVCTEVALTRLFLESKKGKVGE